LLPILHQRNRLTGEVLNEIAQLLGLGDLRQKNATLKSSEDLRETRAEMIDRRLNITGQAFR
jgi:hypothetical protein